LDLVGHACRQLFLQELAHFAAEGLFLGGKVQIHVFSFKVGDPDAHGTRVWVHQARFRLSKSAPRATRSSSNAAGFQNTGSSLANSLMSARICARPTLSAYFMGPPRQRGKP